MRLLAPVLFGAAMVQAKSSAPKNTVLCGQYDTHWSANQSYTFNTNEWGDDGSGAQCISVNNATTDFNATWSWSDNPTLVHSFPNIKLQSDLLPIELSNLSHLNISASWSMNPSSSSVENLDTIDAAANVVVDMFLDTDPTTANSTTLPKYEVMIWIAAYGGKKPIGFSSSIKNPPTHSLNGTIYTLYSGANNNGQFVYSWLAPSNVTTFDRDISPLLHYLWQHKLISESNYLGVVQFGTETFHASSNVTFSAQDFNISVAAGQPLVDSRAAGGALPNLVLLLLPLAFFFTFTCS
ncbi:concanavalin A-like lectin/glucanase [Mollisia scopiformis]|uniref:Concanavalin A-like lectin/glucanase n=1 Tax=Mollisia scopiformis TaxID=149040 RepID=A0A194X0X2_MOLSC|nr:concanavalin A-like lectin/glucanase [Mollisia scopiformis]KUJ13835.1 concanavalin A-like lectin/glucanase [Mollisia scopiformis]